MSIVAIGYSLANLLGGLVSRLMAVVEEAGSLDIYTGGFATIGICTLAIGMIIIAAKNYRRVFDFRRMIARTTMTF